MFARHTPTRMRGSGVVQSLKSWASKLHPQLPLNAKESQRLLTALTSSFRQQLDQAHPVRAPGDDSNVFQSGAAKAKDGRRELHASSVDSADRHLTSILTSPLMARSYGAKPSLVMDYASAQKSFLRDPFQDTISLLEEYEKHGAATIDIAALCLEKFLSQVNTLSDADRAKIVAARAAGSRALRWLQRSGNHDTDEFVDGRHFMQLMCSFVIEEGHEEILWTWLDKDVCLGSQTPPNPAHVGIKLRWFQNRWKGRLLASMVVALLESGRPFRSANLALDAIYRGMSSGLYIPLAAAMMKFRKAFHERGNNFRNTDAKQFDWYMNTAFKAGSGGSNTVVSWDEISLFLFHPHCPVAHPFLGFIQALRSRRPSDAEIKMLRSLERATGVAPRTKFHLTFMRAAALLTYNGLSNDSAWLVDQAALLYPELVHHSQHDLHRELRDFDINWGPAALSSPSKEVPESLEKNSAPVASIPFPSFT